MKCVQLLESSMDIHWNTLVIPQPPQTTIIIPPNTGVNINAFVASINSLDSLLKRINLDFAGALCSRLIYKIKTKFRTTKWMNLMEKINQSMLKLLQMKFSPALRKISESTLSHDSQLPSRSMLEWFLIKMQGFARLLVRLVITSHRAGEMFRQCLSIGHNWQIIVTLMSLASQIWTNCQLLLHETFKCYKVTHKTILGSVLNQKPWSSAGLPKDLGIWISEELATLGCDVADIFKISLPELRVWPEPETSNIKDDVSDEETVPTDVTSFEEGFEDFGEIISRDVLIIPSAVEHSSSTTARTLHPKNILFGNQEDNFECVNSSDKNIEIERKTKNENTKKSKQEEPWPPIIEKNSEESTELTDGSSYFNGIVTKKKKSKKKKKISVEHNDQNLNSNDIKKEIVNSKTMKSTIKNDIKKVSELKTQLKKKKKNKSNSSLIVTTPTTIIMHKPIVNTLSYNSESLKPNGDFDNLLSKAHNGNLVKKLKQRKRKLSIVGEDDIESLVKKKKTTSKQTVETINSKSDEEFQKTKHKPKKRKKKRGFNTFSVEDVT